jgi:MoaA/NifB/PqqE/SkfB family radical SAM enzyme
MRLFRLASDVARSNFGDPALPFKLTFILTYRCQLRCSMCRIWERRPVDELTVEEIRRFLRSSRFSWVNLSGGEIFLRSDIDEVFHAVVDESPRLYVIDFPTHGFQTDRIVASTERLVARRVPRILVTISVDGPPSVHDRIRGVEGSWARAVETFRRLRSIRRRGFRVFLGLTLQRANLDLFDATLESVREEIGDVSPREIHANLGHVSSHYYGNDEFVPPDSAEAIRALEAIRQARGSSIHPVAWIERRYQSLAKRYLGEGRIPLPCHALASSVFVDSTGNVYPCSVWDRRVGNLRDHDYDLRPLLAAAEATRLRGDARRGRCPQCWTPCEAFPTIVSNLVPRPRARRALEDPVPATAPAEETGKDARSDGGERAG